VRRGLEAWQRDDRESFLATMDPSVEWHGALEGLLFGRGESAYRGLGGMLALWTGYRTELEDFQVSAQELRDAGDCVVLLGHIHWRGRASEIELDSPVGMVITVSDGKIVRSVDYLSHAEALEAAGLRE
jgi:ketosteroid isomerase-like protein